MRSASVWHDVSRSSVISANIYIYAHTIEDASCQTRSNQFNDIIYLHARGNIFVNSSF